MDYTKTLSNSKLLQIVVFGPISLLLFVLIRKIYEILSWILQFRSWPQDRGHFILGNVKQLVPNFPSFSSKAASTTITDFLIGSMKYQTAHDGVFVFWLGWYPMVAITNHRAAEAVLSLPNHRKGEEYAFLGLKDGIVVSHGDKWKARRKMIEPFFNTKSLTTYISGMNQAFNLMTKELKEKRIETIDMGETIHKRSLDIIMKSTMSVPIEEEINYKNTAINDIEACETIALTRILNPALWLDAIFHQTNAGRFFKKACGRLMAIMEDKIVERINSKREMTSKVDEKEQKMRHDLIDLLVMHHDPNSKDVTQSIDVAGMTEEILNLMVAGHDTISAGLRWTLFLLGNHIDWQEKIYEEISNNLDIDQDPETLEDINSLIYLDWCIKESMRLFPPIPLVTRKLEYDVETDREG